VWTAQDDQDIRVDYVGNVVFRKALPGSPLSWNLDHIFPWALGGLSQVPNWAVLHERANKWGKSDRVFNRAVDADRLRVGITPAASVDAREQGLFYGARFNALFDSLKPGDVR
jgi:hypothetical protein